MLLHFKLNCFIFLMLVGQINLGEKVSGNIDAFFDPSVDDLQDNFYDIPFIPDTNNNRFENVGYRALTEHDIFKFGRKKLFKNLNVNRKLQINNKNDRKYKRSDCLSTTTDPNAKEKDILKQRMKNILDDETILENGSKSNQKSLIILRRVANLKKSKLNAIKNHRVKRNVYENQERRHNYVNSLHFSHKYRHKNLKNSFVNIEIDKRTCDNKRVKMPHKHRVLKAPFQSDKHEAFKDEFQEEEPSKVKITTKVNDVEESGCNTTSKPKEHTSESSTKKKHEQSTEKKHEQPKEKKHEQSTEKTFKSATNLSVKQTKEAKKSDNFKKEKSDNLKNEKSFKSILSHKSQQKPLSTTTTTTSASTNEFEEYEDYKAGDYTETELTEKNQKENQKEKQKKGNAEFRAKRDKKQKDDDCFKNGTVEGDGGGGGGKGGGVGVQEKSIEDFLREETISSNTTGEKHQSSVTAKKNSKEDVIDQFLKMETTKAVVTKIHEHKRKAYQIGSPKKNYKNEEPKNEDCPGSSLRKQQKNAGNKNDKKLKERLQLKQHSFFENPPKNEDTFMIDGNEDPDIFEIIQVVSNPQNNHLIPEKYLISETHQKSLNPKIFIVKSKNDDVKLKQRIFVVKPNEDEDDSSFEQKQTEQRDDENENVVNIKETNKKMSENWKKKQKVYVPHTKSQGRQHHRLYFEPEKLPLITKQKTNAEKLTRTPREYFLTTKMKYETTDEVDDETTNEIDELYNEIPVDKKRIQLSLNCDAADYANKQHCICSVKTMLRDLMDDLKDINVSLNYQYDCSKYINIEPGVVIANDSRALVLSRRKRDIYFNRFLLRKGARIGRDVDTLLNEDLNVEDLDDSIYAIVGSKVVIHCGNSSSDYNDDDQIVWTVQHGSPETAGFKEDNGRELVMERVSAQDTNNYTCAVSHKVEDGVYGPTQKFLHRLSVVEIPVYNLMITVILNESARCDQEDLEILHNYYPLMLNKFLCHATEQICSVTVDTPHCTKSHPQNGVSMHVTLKTLPLNTILPALRKKQQICGINCQSRIYSIIVKTLQNNFASVANLPVFFRDNNEHKKFVPVQYEHGDKSNMFSNSILTICPQGFGIFQQNEKLCLTCEPQTYNPGNKKNCVPCPSGSYQPMYGAGSCLPCTSPLDDARCIFGSKAELAPKLYFIIPIILVLVIIVIILYCVCSSMRKSKRDADIDYMSGKNYEPPESIQTKVIEQVFTGEPSEKSYSTVAARRATRQSQQSEEKRKSKPEPPPIDFN